MEQIRLHDVDHNLEDIELSKEYPIDNQDAVYFNEHSANKKTTSSRNDINMMMTRRTILMMKAH